jgi:hypothetical protein
MKSFGSQLKKDNRLSRASTGSRLILLVPIKLRVLELIPVACSITSYVQGLPVCRSLRAISSLSANFTAIPPNVSLLSFYPKYCLCQMIFVLPGIFSFYWLTYLLECGMIALSKTSRAALELRPLGTALTKANPPGGGQQWLTRIYHPLRESSNSLPSNQSLISPTWAANHPPRSPLSASKSQQLKVAYSALLAVAEWMRAPITTPALIAVTG